MKRLSFIAFLCLALGSGAMAQSAKQYMFLTSIESIVPGGMGRSKMITTKPDGQQTEEDLRNFYSLVGINFGNIKDNDEDILQKVNALIAEGWILEFVNTGVQSPSETQGPGIYMTRYMFSQSK